MAVVLFILAVCGIPLLLMHYSSHSTKRGCGRGCATCGNRDICHRKKSNKEQQG